MKSGLDDNFFPFFKRLNPDLEHNPSTVRPILLAIYIDRLRAATPGGGDQRKKAFVVFQRVRSVGAIQNCQTLLDDRHGSSLTQAEIVAFFAL